MTLNLLPLHLVFEGFGTTGALGNGTYSSSSTPEGLAGGYIMIQVSAGDQHACGLSEFDRLAYCWGSGASGRIGNGGTNSSATPVPVVGSYTWATISAGASHTCAVTLGGAALCWGNNFYGQLGTGSTIASYTPTAVSGGFTWDSIACGRSHTCGIVVGGTAYCFGRNNLGQLGIGETAYYASVSTPQPVLSNAAFTQLAASSAASVDQYAGYHVCGLTTTGDIYCWGNANQGQLGTNAAAYVCSTVSCNPIPALVAGGYTWTAVSTGGLHTCAVSSSGAAFCWGAFRCHLRIVENACRVDS